jgi:hypothetical protein
MNRAALVAFLVAVVGQWIVPLAGVFRHERVLARGEVVRIRCAAPDPYDMLRGRYLAVRAEQTRAPAPAGMPAGVRVPVWATLVEGDDGVSTIASLSLEPLVGPRVIRLVATDAGEGSATVWWPFDRLYLNEKLGPAADALAAKRVGEGKLPVAEIRLLDGQAVLADVTFDGTGIRQLVKP